MVNFTFSFFETLIQKLVTHCHYYLVRECYILQSLFQNCTCPHRQAGATGCQPSMATSSVSDEASNSLSIMRFPSPGQRWYILMTKDKTTDSEAMHYGIWQERCRLWLEENPVDVPRADEVLSANTDRHPFTWCGVFVSGMATSHCFCKLASAGGWWKLTDRRCLDCLLHAWRASKVNP